jgi:hypothetical protein
MNKLNLFEGCLDYMYVPVDKAGRVRGVSGPTIATGIDFGAIDPDKLNISEELKAKLRPYYGKSGQAALDYVKAHPLKLSKAEVNELNAAVMHGIIKNLIPEYNKASKIEFKDLPEAA